MKQREIKKWVPEESIKRVYKALKKEKKNRLAEAFTKDYKYEGLISNEKAIASLTGAIL